MTTEQHAEKQQYADFEFNLRELAGSMGDFGTLFPLAISYIAINGLNPAGLFIMLGLTNIALGLIYRLPMPLQPRGDCRDSHRTGLVAFLVYASGFGLGLIWLVLVLPAAAQAARPRLYCDRHPACAGRAAQVAGIRVMLPRLCSGWWPSPLC